MLCLAYYWLSIIRGLGALLVIDTLKRHIWHLQKALWVPCVTPQSLQSLKMFSSP